MSFPTNICLVVWLVLDFQVGDHFHINFQKETEVMLPVVVEADGPLLVPLVVEAASSMFPELTPNS